MSLFFESANQNLEGLRSEHLRFLLFLLFSIFTQIQVCITEAEKLGLMMQFQSPRLTAHLEMAPLVAAYVQMPVVSMATYTQLSPWLLVFWVFHVAWGVYG